MATGRRQANRDVNNGVTKVITRHRPLARAVTRHTSDEELLIIVNHHHCRRLRLEFTTLHATLAKNVMSRP